MIPRRTAESVVALLERALDGLRGAHSVAEATSNTLTVQIEPIWAATANTGGLLGLIYEAYPDLPGKDPVAAVIKGSEEQVRLKLLDALSQLERAATAIDAAEGMTAEDKQEIGARFSQSLAALRVALQRLAEGPEREEP